MKRMILFALGIIFYSTALAQSTPLYSDNFESYPFGMGIAFANPTWWTTWNNLPGSAEDGLINPLHGSSGTQSVLIDNLPSQSDLLLKLGNKTNGKYDLSWKMYFETGEGGYYNIQHFESPGIEWACEVWFDGDGTGTLTAGISAYPFTYAHDMWIRVEHIIDLDNDFIKLIIGGSVVAEWPFSYQVGTTSGTKQLGAVDFFATTFDGSTPEYYVDDISYTKFGPYVSYFENFDTYFMMDPIAQVNPTWWKTWNNLPGTDEDGRIINMSYSSPYSLMISDYPIPKDVVLKLGERTSGKYQLSWKMFMLESTGGYYNMQHFETVGLEYAFEIYFHADGSGYLYTGGAFYPFNYPKTSWFPVDHVIDLNNDRIQLFINNILVHEWPFSYQSGFTTGTNSLGGVDFFATSGEASQAQYFVDNIVFAPMNQVAIPIANWSIFLAMGLLLISSLIVYFRTR